VVTARAERARRLTRTGFPAGAGSRVPGAARDVTGASGGAPDAATMQSIVTGETGGMASARGGRQKWR